MNEAIHYSYFDDGWPCCVAPPLGPKFRGTVPVTLQQQQVTCELCKKLIKQASALATLALKNRSREQH